MRNLHLYSIINCKSGNPNEINSRSFMVKRVMDLINKFDKVNWTAVVTGCSESPMLDNYVSKYPDTVRVIYIKEQLSRSEALDVLYDNIEFNSINYSSEDYFIEYTEKVTPDVVRKLTQEYSSDLVVLLPPSMSSYVSVSGPELIRLHKEFGNLTIAHKLLPIQLYLSSPMLTEMTPILGLDLSNIIAINLMYFNEITNSKYTIKSLIVE